MIRYSDPDWIGQLHRGAQWILWSIFILIICSICTYAHNSRHLFDPIVAPLVLLSSDFCAAIGYWLLTIPDPSGLGEDLYGTSRRLTRMCIFVNAFQQFWSVANLFVHIPAEFLTTIAVIFSACSLVGCVGFISLLNYLSKFCRRLPDLQLEKRSRWLRLAIALPFVMVVSVQGIDYFQRVRVGRKATIPDMGIITGLSVLFMIIFGVYYLELMRRLGRSLVEQKNLASESWNASEQAIGTDPHTGSSVT